MATVREVAEWFAFAYHSKRKRPRRCHNADGQPKRAFRTKRRANKARLKYQRVYACPDHGFHLTSQPKRADTD